MAVEHKSQVCHLTNKPLQHPTPIWHLFVSKWYLLVLATVLSQNMLLASFPRGDDHYMAVVVQDPEFRMTGAGKQPCNELCVW